MARCFDQREQISPVFGKSAAFCRQPAQGWQRIAHAGCNDRRAGAAGKDENECGKRSEHGKRP